MSPLLYHIKDVMFYNKGGKMESKFVGLQVMWRVFCMRSGVCGSIISDSRNLVVDFTQIPPQVTFFSRAFASRLRRKVPEFLSLARTRIILSSSGPLKSAWARFGGQRFGLVLIFAPNGKLHIGRFFKRSNLG